MKNKFYLTFYVDLQRLNFCFKFILYLFGRFLFIYICNYLYMFSYGKNHELPMISQAVTSQNKQFDGYDDEANASTLKLSFVKKWLNLIC